MSTAGGRARAARRARARALIYEKHQSILFKGDCNSSNLLHFPQNFLQQVVAPLCPVILRGRWPQAGKYWTPGACLVRVTDRHIGWRWYFSIFNDFHRSIHPCTDTKGQLVVSRRTAPSSRRLVHPDLSTQTRYGLDSAAPAELVEDPVRAAADAHIARPRPTATPMRCRQCFPNSIADQW